MECERKTEQTKKSVREIAAEHDAVNARIRAMVAAMPPFTPEERARLRILLRPTSRS